MEEFFKYLNLYTVNETTLSSDLIKFDTNKRYTIGLFVNNNLECLLINYKFAKSAHEIYHFTHEYSKIRTHNFEINSGDTKTNIFEMINDFNYTHLYDIISTHYDKENANNEYNKNTNRICVNLDRYQIYTYGYLSLPYPNYLSKLDHY